MLHNPAYDLNDVDLIDRRQYWRSMVDAHDTAPK